MCMQYSARIIENGKARYADCSGYTPGDALLRLVQLRHIRKGAIVHLGSAMWELVGSGLVQYLTAKPE